MMPIRCFAVVGSLIFLLGCSGTKPGSEIAKEPAVTLFMEAADRVKDLGKDGKLPGFSKDDHGMITSHRMPAGVNITYPFLISMQVEKAKDEDAIYWFVLQKDAENSKFEVIEAWKTNSRGEHREDLKEKQ